MVAQYTVLEANGKVNGIGENSRPYPSQTLWPMPFQIYHYVPPRESMCKIWLQSIQPLPRCACVKKPGLGVGFFVNVSIYVNITKQNWNQFLYVVKATALKQQISKFHPQIQRTDASDHICVSQWPVINVKPSLCSELARTLQIYE